MPTNLKASSERVLQGALVNYLVSQARTVESSVNRALWALLGARRKRMASEVFLTEPRINEMEITIDEHAIRLLQRGSLSDADVRLIVASLKINNDLERIGDLAVNLCERTISLAAMGEVQAPPELEPMTAAVRAMVSKCLGALIFQNVDLATQVLESDDVVDQFRDRVGLSSRRNGPRRFAGCAQPAVRPRLPQPRTDRRSRHQHRRRHFVLGARPRSPARAAPQQHGEFRIPEGGRRSVANSATAPGASRTLATRTRPLTALSYRAFTPLSLPVQADCLGCAQFFEA